MQRGDNQPKTCDGGCVRVEVHTRDVVQASLRQHRCGRRRLTLLPKPEEPLERAYQEVSRATGWVHEPYLFEAELVEGRLERAVQDEALDELRRLQQRVALLRRIGQILVEIAKEPCVEFLVAEVVDERSTGRIDFRERFAERACTVCRRP
jgi:hypothetical protein